jgi:hypothetical protein
MTARFENREHRPAPLLPKMAKEVIFWCAVLAALMASAVLIGDFGAIW